MRIRSKLLQCLHLDSKYHLLTMRGVKIIHTLFQMLDVHEENSLNDLIFYYYMKQASISLCFYVIPTYLSLFKHRREVD